MTNASSRGADARGVDFNALTTDQRRALRVDLEMTLSLRLRRAGNAVRLAQKVAIVDQRTSILEAA